jgi:hypothetical protein
MKITEITAQSGKAIKRLQRLYSSYVINPTSYVPLCDLLIVASNSDDFELRREAEIIKEKLLTELLEALKK